MSPICPRLRSWPSNLSWCRSGRLRFSAQLEVSPQYVEDVTKLIPRVMDVLNSYLRAVSLADIEDPGALVSLRAQMLRRVQLVTGEGRVRDLLVMEFVLN
jgi:flagellar FliL protein